MTREITQRELRNESAEIMRQLDRGESFIVTRNGVPVGHLTPIRKRRFVPVERFLAVFGQDVRIDAARFREDVDSILDQDPPPRT